MKHIPPAIVLLASAIAGCGGSGGEVGIDNAALEAPASTANAPLTPNPLRNAYFGDVHVHTVFSYDAFIFGTRSGPEDAYRYAKGEAIQHAAGFDVQMSAPLDFYAVADHASFLGMLKAMSDPEQEVSKTPLAKMINTATTDDERRTAFTEMRSHTLGQRTGMLDKEVVRSAWREIVASAERHNDPGKFTTFIAYEYTGSPEGQNLHRNVIFRGSAVPDIPFSRLDSMNPEALWSWMDGNREAGMEALAIPHNSNGSNGQMFELEKFEGEPLDAAYAEQRMRNEPLVEITQVKGTSDTHPALSPNDEWADFEIFPYIIATTTPSTPSGSYVREAYLNGLEMEEAKGFNPYRFGLIGSSDSHNAAGSPEEDNFFSKVGRNDATPEQRGSVPLDVPNEDGSEYTSNYYHYWGASGLAGVWAEENTRESIYDAFRRKETFATSGPRMRIRFFAGYDFEDGLLADPNMIEVAYAEGIAMGGDLRAEAGLAPRFLVWAMRDPNSAPLQRLQVVKGWVADGEAQERVYDVGCSDGLEVSSSTHRCPDNGAEVNLDDCTFGEDVGASELRALWTDPNFDAAQRAFYHVRVLENPSCRWSTWDAIRAGVKPRPNLAPTLQERAWSSPIWYIP